MWRAAARLAVRGEAGAADEAGFTVLEMLVALSILAVAALTLVRLDAFSLRSAGELDGRHVAAIVAQNRAVEIWTDAAAPTMGTARQSVENGGRQWWVEQRVARTADPDLLRIDVRVERAGRGTGQGAGQAVLTIIRRAR